MVEQRQILNGLNDSNLIPLESLDLSKIKSVNDLILGMENTSFNGRKLAEAVNQICEWDKNKETVVLSKYILSRALSKPTLQTKPENFPPHKLIITGPYSPEIIQPYSQNATSIISINENNQILGHSNELFVYCEPGFALKVADACRIERKTGKKTEISDFLNDFKELNQGANILAMMKMDSNSYNVLTLSGAMTIAKQGLLICDMIDQGYINCVVSTGALMAHGFVEAAGMTHFKQAKEESDCELYKKGYNRVYDTIELEQNLDDAEKIIRQVLDLRISKGNLKPLSSVEFNYLLGEYLSENTQGRGILKSAYHKKIPVFVPAFTDSELALDIGIWNKKRKINKKSELKLDPIKDLETYTKLMLKAKTWGIFTIGGGVPRNWAQQVGPYLDITQKRVGQGGANKKFTYGVKICPEPIHWGGLSGCTYSEGVSWGKFVPENEGGMYSEIKYDATIAWPFILKAAMEKVASFE